MTAQNRVPDLVQGSAAAEERNDAGALDGLLGEGWRLAHVHIGPLQGPPGAAS